VLVVGESGTGKELIARAVHELGARARGPFVTVDCGALSPSLVAGELFGHERGSFTGAEKRHAGAFERADGGTLFLDEVGELPAAQQASLLGVLERRRFRRVGGSDEVAVDVRVVSATNRDLRAQVNGGGFRLDLYYRLAVVTLRVAPLRERAEDVPLLVEHFAREYGHAGPVAELFAPAAMVALQGYGWPGNVRELKNMVLATMAMGEPPLDELAAHQGPRDEPAVAGAKGDGPEGAAASLLDVPYRDARAAVLEDFETRYLRRLIERTAGNVTRASREAQMDRSHLIDMLRKHGLR
jgi:DNA-binding NtrC family response regulator